MEDKGTKIIFTMTKSDQEGAVGGQAAYDGEEESELEAVTSEVGSSHGGYASAYEAALIYWETGYAFTDIELDIIRASTERIEEPREGSVGKWVKNHLYNTIKSS